MTAPVILVLGVLLQVRAMLPTERSAAAVTSLTKQGNGSSEPQPSPASRTSACPTDPAFRPPKREYPTSRHAPGASTRNAQAILRCLIVDDSPHFLNAARGLLERQGVTVVGVASNAADALQRAEKLRPDVLLLDIDLGGESGLELARRLHDQAGQARAPVILISTHAEQDYAELIAASPAIGFLPKTALSAQAIRKLLAGHDDGGCGDLRP